MKKKLSETPVESMAERGRGKKGRPNPVDVHVGTRIRMRRALLGMSQEKLAESVGITFQQVQKYERGTNRVSASRLYQFSKILNVPISFFFEKYSSDSGMKPARATAASYGFAEGPQAKPVADKQLYDKESLELLKVYYSISDPKLRKDIFKIIRSMAENIR